MNLTIRSKSVYILPHLAGMSVDLAVTAEEAKGLIVELLGKLPEQEAAELIRSEFPDWLEA